MSSYREELKVIVTRNGQSGRIPARLEDELDKLEAFVAQKQKEAETRLLNGIQNIYAVNQEFGGNIELAVEDFIMDRLSTLQSTTEEENGYVLKPLKLTRGVHYDKPVESNIRPEHKITLQSMWRK